MISNEEEAIENLKLNIEKLVFLNAMIKARFSIRLGELDETSDNSIPKENVQSIMRTCLILCEQVDCTLACMMNDESKG